MSGGKVIKACEAFELHCEGSVFAPKHADE